MFSLFSPLEYSHSYKLYVKILIFTLPIVGSSGDIRGNINGLSTLIKVYTSFGTRAYGFNSRDLWVDITRCPIYNFPNTRKVSTL